jgi:hypothetical protein
VSANGPLTLTARVVETHQRRQHRVADGQSLVDAPDEIPVAEPGVGVDGDRLSQ